MPLPADPLPAVPCSTAARERQDPMLGTAPPQRRFLLVEADGGWGFGGFPELPLPEDVKDEVVARADAVGARVMLVRRPGRHSSTVCSLRAWCVIDTTAPAGGRVTWGTWAYPAELLGALDRLEELASGGGKGSLASSQARDEPLVLVCTHGKKDPCCAVRGRPVAQALARRWPEETWECSHTGGDRFAANVLLLPDGAAYGGLDVETALAAVEAHRRGEPGTAYLRGAVGWPRPVQAAVVAVHDQLGPLPWGSVRPSGTAPAVAGAGEVAATTVTLGLEDGRRVAVDVTEHRRPEARLTCRTAGASRSQVPVPGRVRVLD
ncbi:sucrase ferredoxin [Ornithinimicrobium cerasi]|uniref:Sucrase/ferredoxin-like n=1 Tax=Ornithinimicrobium cerasi TaxID=2248773 RepID=A0A285VG40_9MICO|nr:sucrase ferredoxin [Ornithinimicrobium cerasi]SOC52538.1 hypothetical protein SAMN05421879_101654 [Ornithinimicrobium cerasi]